MAQSGSASGRQAAKFQKTPEELDITPHFLRTMTLESNDVVRFSLDEEKDFGAAIGNPLSRRYRTPGQQCGPSIQR